MSGRCVPLNIHFGLTKIQCNMLSLIRFWHSGTMKYVHVQPIQMKGPKYFWLYKMNFTSVLRLDILSHNFYMSFLIIFIYCHMWPHNRAWPWLIDIASNSIWIADKINEFDLKSAKVVAPSHREFHVTLARTHWVLKHLFIISKFNTFSSNLQTDQIQRTCDSSLCLSHPIFRTKIVICKNILLEW